MSKFLTILLEYSFSRFWTVAKWCFFIRLLRFFHFSLHNLIITVLKHIFSPRFSQPIRRSCFSIIFPFDISHIGQEINIKILFPSQDRYNNLVISITSLYLYLKYIELMILYLPLSCYVLSSIFIYIDMLSFRSFQGPLERHFISFSRRRALGCRWAFSLLASHTFSFICFELFFDLVRRWWVFLIWAACISESYYCFLFTIFDVDTAFTMLRLPCPSPRVLASASSSLRCFICFPTDDYRNFYYCYQYFLYFASRYALHISTYCCFGDFDFIRGSHYQPSKFSCALHFLFHYIYISLEKPFIY